MEPTEFAKTPEEVIPIHPFEFLHILKAGLVTKYGRKPPPHIYETEGLQLADADGELLINFLRANYNPDFRKGSSIFYRFGALEQLVKHDHALPFLEVAEGTLVVHQALVQAAAILPLEGDFVLSPDLAFATAEIIVANPTFAETSYIEKYGSVSSAQIGAGNMTDSEAKRRRYVLSVPMTMDHIFISYRRSDSGSFIPKLFEKLSGHFPPEKIFHDKVSIKVGENFVQKIDSILAQCGFFIPVIGKDWISIAGETSQSRLFDVNDFVRIEIESAIERGLSMAPILLNGAQMPQVEQLPEQIRAIRKINSISLDENNLDHNFKDLVESIKLGLEYAKFQSSDRIVKDYWAQIFNEDFRDGKLKRKGNQVLCQICQEYYDPDKNNYSSCSNHPDDPESIGNTGPIYDYAEIWKFPCCNKVIKGEITPGGVDVKPSRYPGCRTGMHRPYKEA